MNLGPEAAAGTSRAIHVIGEALAAAIEPRVVQAELRNWLVMAVFALTGSASKPLL